MRATDFKRSREIYLVRTLNSIFFFPDCFLRESSLNENLLFACLPLLQTGDFVQNDGEIIMIGASISGRAISSLKKINLTSQPQLTFIQGVQGAQYLLSIIRQFDLYCSGDFVFCTGIKRDSHTPLYFFERGTADGEEFKDKTFEPYSEFSRI